MLEGMTMLEFVWNILKYFTGLYLMFYLGVWVGITAVQEGKEDEAEGVATFIAYTGFTIGAIVLVVLWLYYGIMTMV